MAEVRNELLYTENHMWVRVEGPKVYVGMTDFAQNDLGDVVFVDLPKPGKEVKMGDEFGAMESVKTVEPIYAPVSGKILESNAALSDAPEKVNESPYDDGWITVIELNDPEELKRLLNASAYGEMI